MLIKKGTSSNTNVLTQGNHRSAPILYNYLQSGNRNPKKVNTFTEKNLKKAMDDCYSFIKYSDYYENKPSKERNIKEIDAIKKTILKNYSLLYYELPEEKTVYKTFESLNSRGLPVEAIDNFKCQLMGIAFAENDVQAVNQLHVLWTQIYDEIGKERINEDDIISISATLFKSSDDFKTTPKSVAEAMKYFYDVATMAIPVDCIPERLKHKKQSHDTKGYRCQMISELVKEIATEMVSIHKDRSIDAITDIQQARILLIAIRMSHYNDSDKKALLSAWEKTTFRLFCLHRKDSRSFRGDYISCAEKIIRGEPVHAVELCIQSIGDRYTFAEGLKNVKTSKWYPDYNNDVIFIMRRYDEYLAKENGASISSSTWAKIWENDPSTTIEHIFPKTFPKNNQKEFKKNWAHGGKQFSQEKLDGFVDNIGNLTILEPGQNAKAGQKPYKDKIALYGNTMYIHPDINSQYLQNGYWTKESILAREKDILAFIEKIWK